MTNRDRIRTQVGAVKRDTQALLKRLRDERVEKARARRPLVQSRSSAAAPQQVLVDEALVAHDRFTAGPGVDRFFEGRESEAPLKAPMDAGPPTAQSVAPNKTPKPNVRPVDHGALLGLEPVVVLGTEGRRHPEPRLTPVDKAGVAIGEGLLPPLFDAGHRVATPAPRPSQLNRAGVKTRRIDPIALGLEPVFGGSVELPLAPSRPLPAEKKSDAVDCQPTAPPVASQECGSVVGLSTSRPLALATIAAIGPGLAWKLQNLGIMSLEDLVSADADALRNGLGPLGALVRLDSWIDEAKQLLASRRPSSSQS